MVTQTQMWHPPDDPLLLGRAVRLRDQGRAMATGDPGLLWALEELTGLIDDYRQVREDTSWAGTAYAETLRAGTSSDLQEWCGVVAELMRFLRSPTPARAAD